MSKFDRCIFMSIAIGIWAFVLTQFFVPEPLIAHDDVEVAPAVIWYSDPDSTASNEIC